MFTRFGKLKYWKKHKYNAVRTECGDHSHPSKLEQKVCFELQMRLKAGDIKDFVRQRPFPLYLGKSSTGRTIIPDFYVTHNDGTIEFIEAKGMEMPDWKLKWLILEHMYDGDPNVKFTVIK